MLIAGLLLAWPASAHTPQQPPHQLYSEGDLGLESGEAIRILRSPMSPTAP
jgi:homoserine O-acetyltransferase